jgi:hypothetical protein
MTFEQASQDPSSDDSSVQAVGGSPAESLVELYVAAMQRGPDGHVALAGLFAEDGVYIEPFSGTGPHVGPDAIRAYLLAAADQAPTQFQLIVERLDVAAGRAVVHWRCESPAFATPSRGTDTFDVRDGLIVRLQTMLTQPPTFRPSAQGH